jgi:hypothetical protein
VSIDPGAIVTVIQWALQATYAVVYPVVYPMERDKAEYVGVGKDRLFLFLYKYMY